MWLAEEKMICYAVHIMRTSSPSMSALTTILNQFRKCVIAVFELAFNSNHFSIYYILSKFVLIFEKLAFISKAKWRCDRKLESCRSTAQVIEVRVLIESHYLSIEVHNSSLMCKTYFFGAFQTRLLRFQSSDKMKWNEMKY